MRGIKSAVRDLMPSRMQVPIRYSYGRLRNELEPEMAWLPALVAHNDRVIDVGGNRGTYAYRLYRLGARVEVFEPNPACLRVLRPWASGKGKVTVHAVGLSDANGTAELVIPVDKHGVEHDASASLEHDGGLNARHEVVPIRTLDSFGFRDAVLVKIDVEGHERCVISGSLETISASSPALLVEIEQRHLSVPIGDVFRRILALGYQGFFMCNGKPRSIASFDLKQHQRLSSFERRDGAYFNNFLFLADAKIREKVYTEILDR